MAVNGEDIVATSFAKTASCDNSELVTTVRTAVLRERDVCIEIHAVFCCGTGKSLFFEKG